MLQFKMLSFHGNFPSANLILDKNQKSKGFVANCPIFWISQIFQWLCLSKSHLSQKSEKLFGRFSNLLNLASWCRRIGRRDKHVVLISLNLKHLKHEDFIHFYISVYFELLADSGDIVLPALIMISLCSPFQFRLAWNSFSLIFSSDRMSSI